ncbi:MULTISPECIES: hypothetical protein [unclassified Microcoleus]|uniref:hypothetical protein n=1 Tax=unclassified Microcoleus TaxID=2642155 RepID=UPI002FCFE7E6
MKATVSIAMPHAVKDGANAVTMCSPLNHKDMSLDTIWGDCWWEKKEQKLIPARAESC